MKKKKNQTSHLEQIAQILKTWCLSPMTTKRLQSTVVTEKMSCVALINVNEAFTEESRRIAAKGEEIWLLEKNGGWQGGRLVNRWTFPHLPYLLFMWDPPPRCLPTQHLVSLFCIKVGRVTWLLLLKSAAGRSAGRLMSTWGSRAVVAGGKTAAGKRILTCSWSLFWKARRSLSDRNVSVVYLRKEHSSPL